MKTHFRGRRLALWLAPALLMGTMGLAACGTSSAKTTHTPTAAELLASATSALNLSGTTSSSTTVKDLTFSMKFGIDMNLSGLAGTPSATSSSLGTGDINETITANGKETLDPRRTQMDMSMAILGHNITTTVIVDYATKAGYVNAAGLSALGADGVDTAKPWYKVSYASVSGFGADTSMFTDYSKLKNATVVGGETLNGVRVWHLRAKEDLTQALPGSGGATGTSASGDYSVSTDTDYYFRQDNYLPVKVNLAGTTSLSSLGTMKITGEMDFTAFNTGVTIALPDPSQVQALNV